MRILFRKVLLLVFVVAAFAPAVLAAALDVPPAPTDIPIVDQTATLTPEQKNNLAAKIATERSSTGNQIAILIIPTLDQESLEEYSIRVARDWGIGTKERDNGVLLLVALNDKKLRIEVGYGLEGALTDARSSQIIRDRITPAFRQGNYYEGIDSGLDGIIHAIHNETDPALNANGDTIDTALNLPWEALIYGVFFLPIWLGSMLARTKSWWAGGIIGALIGIVIAIFAGFIMVGLVSILLLAIAGLLFDRAVSNNFRQRKEAGLTPSWWAGGTHIGGNGSSGFGGFGGGSFGGGGSSGSW